MKDKEVEIMSRCIPFLLFDGADFHFKNISKGIIDSRDVIYFLSVVFIGLYCTHLAMRGKN